jgi:hypothetical protein
MRVKILYWSPDGELIFLEHFHSITDLIFLYKIRPWFSSLLNRIIDSDIKVLNHILLALASDHDKQKSKNMHKFVSAKNKLVALTYHKAGLLMQYPWKYQVKKVIKVSGSKSGKCKFHDVWKSKFSWLIYDSSNNVNYVVWCLQKGRHRYCWQNRICYCKKKLKVKCESLVFLNNSLKREKCFNMVSAKAHSPTKHVLSHSGD